MKPNSAESVACYCRVSTRQQRTDSQKAEIQRWLKGHGLNPKSVHWFEDHESGKSLQRPAFEQLQQEIFSGQIRTVVVWKLDRLKSPLDALKISHDSPSGNLGFSFCFSLFISPFIAPAQRAEASLDRHYSAFAVLGFLRWLKVIIEIPDCAEATGVLVRALFGRVLPLPEHSPALCDS